jgi:hypothetical protein
MTIIEEQRRAAELLMKLQAIIVSSTSNMNPFSVGYFWMLMEHTARVNVEGFQSVCTQAAVQSDNYRPEEVLQSFAEMRKNILDSHFATVTGDAARDMFKGDKT